MSCNHPLKAFKTGYMTENLKDEYIICEGSDDFLSVALASKRKKVAPSAPLVSFGGHTFLKDPINVPCGHCIGCRMDKAKEWKVRCCKEAERYPKEYLHFVTLTYDDPHLFKRCVTPSGEIALNKKDIQDFMKRLRSRVYPNKVRFFGCGEYGGLYHRPHFHLIIFGDAFPDKFHIRGTLWKSAILADAWQYGYADIKEVVPNMIAYVAGYTEKKQADPDWFSYPVKPFLVMSRRPGIGYDVDYDHAKDYARLYGDFGGVHSSRLSRFYLNRLERLDPVWRESYREKCKEIGQVYSDIDDLIYGTSNKDRIGLLKDKMLQERLERKRIEKL